MYDQVLTRVSPYDSDYHSGVMHEIKRGVRPSRPRWNRWLWDAVWDTITAGWHHEPEQRRDLPAMHNVFLTFGESGPQQLGNLIPQIAFIFQLLRDSEPEIQVRVNEMDKVGSSDLPLLPPQD